MNKKIKILLIILGAILIIFSIVHSLKLWIANYVIIFSNNEKLNQELNINGGSFYEKDNNNYTFRYCDYDT